ncbi:MAG: hypothetical protein CMN84_09175 [Spongiibacteraceae bacterium]|jgi:FkbM family methyltransferase|nr:hypothetical protein [Spongiibacteraceae bacterium]
MRNGISRKVKAFSRRLGIEIGRYPPKPGPTELWEAWAGHLGRSGADKTIFDVGANRGQTISWFRPLFPQARIFAFEPLPQPFAELARLAEVDGNVIPQNLGLGDKAGKFPIYENSVDTTSSLLQNSSSIDLYAPAHMVQPKGNCTIEVRRLDEFCATAGITSIDVLKIDAQGYESRILDGCGDLLNPSNIRALYLELMFVPFYEDQCWGGELIEKLRAHGYRLFGMTGVDYDQQFGWRWCDAMFVPAE